MNKREFIRVSASPFAASLVWPLTAAAQPARLKNWAGNLEYGASTLIEARSVAEVQEAVRKHPRLKVLGTRHCFNTIADSPHVLLSLREMNRLVAFDAAARTVTIEAGMSYGQLCPLLHARGFALHNLASLPHISVAGACATATHGSGVANGNLATAVRAVEIVTADGQVRQIAKGASPGELEGVVVGLGALGVITKLTLAVEPAYEMRQYVYEHLSFDRATTHFDEIMGAGYSVSLFTDWQRDIDEVWVKRRASDLASHQPGAAFFGAAPATRNLHPIAALSAENCTEQMGVPGPWYERLPHFRMGFTPSSGTELQAEYFVPKPHAAEAMRAMIRLAPRIGPHLFISEIRSIAADDLWMSPCRHQPSVAIHFTWKQDWPAVSALLPVIERELQPFRARPHWGKLFTIAQPALASLYERLPAFTELAARFDPDGRFRNEFLDRRVFGA